MLNFDLTEEQQLLEQSVREWAARAVAPRIRELDRAHQFDRGILPQMADLGLLGVSVPQQFGGAGMDYIALGVASEELEYVDTSLRVKGMERLRVIDASIMPTVVSGNTNATAIMIGEKGADMVLQGHEDQRGKDANDRAPANEFRHQ